MIGEEGQEFADLFFAHFERMAFVMEEDIFENPMHVGFLGSRAEVADGHFQANPVE